MCWGFQGWTEKNENEEEVEEEVDVSTRWTFLSLSLFPVRPLSKAQQLTCTSFPLGENVVSEKEYCLLFWKGKRRTTRERSIDELLIRSSSDDRALDEGEKDRTCDSPIVLNASALVSRRQQKDALQTTNGRREKERNARVAIFLREKEREKRERKTCDGSGRRKKPMPLWPRSLLPLPLPPSLSLSGLVDMASSSVAEILNSGPVPLACVRDDARRTLVALLDAVRGGFAEERAVF